MKFFPIAVLVLTYMVGEVFAAGAGTPAPEVKARGKCITPEMVDGVEEKWVDDFSHSPGLYNTISYRFNDWRSTVNFPPAPPVDKNAKHKRCWKVFLKTSNGPFEEFRSTCTYYNDVARQHCRLETAGTSLNGVFRHYGSFQIVMTDQQTYMVVYACLLGSKNYFMTLSRTATLPDATRAKIEDYLINKLKFDKNYVVYNSTNAEIAIQKIEMIECAGATPAFPHWPTFDWDKMFKMQF